MKGSFLKRLFRYIEGYKWLLILSLSFSAIFVVASLFLPVLFGKATDCIVGKDSVDFDRMKKIGLIALICAGVAGLSQWGTEVLCNKIANGVTRKVRNDVFRNLQRLPLKSLDQKRVGDVLGIEIGDADRLSDGLLLGFSRFFTGILTIVGTLVCMAIINPVIALVVALITPLSLFTAKFITGKTYRFFKKQSEIVGKETAIIEETLGNLPTVKAYGAEEHFNERFRNVNDELRKTSFKAVFFSSLTNPTTRFVNSVVYASVALTGALLAVYGVKIGSLSVITAGSLLSLLSYANRYTKPFNEISDVLTELSSAKASATRLFDLIDEPCETDEGVCKTLPEPTKGDVKIENVSFSYVPEVPLIRGFNLTAEQGKKIAIVGPTGCGKTTLINLLMRFYDVNDGCISVDGIPVKEVSRKDLRRRYGMVLQDTWIRRASVRDNVTVGKPDATDEEVIEACKLAHCHSFIEKLPEGYHTVIGEGSLSQGQKQLLCIARVMLCLPPMLILDEATSNIDTRTEIQIQQVFDRLTKGKTSFVVAHRLSTIREADEILVMNKGNIVEQGNHEELLAKGGFYAELYNSQFEKE